MFTFNQLCFQLHWLLGISAGLVIALVGATGAIQSFEGEILRALNPGVVDVVPRAEPALEPDRLLQRLREQQPDLQIASVTLAGDPALAALAFSVPPPGERRGTVHYLDPYSGALLNADGDVLRGQQFFRTVRQLHRWLLLRDDGGKQVVGASTIALVFFAVSGLYLRWPRRGRRLDWRHWLTFNWAHKGRNFLWNLHSVIGTWVLPVYLLTSLTGLYWSYDWYRDMLFSLSGVERPAPRAEVRPPGGSEGNQRGRPEQRTAPQPMPDIALAPAWEAFRREIGDFQRASFTLPRRAGEPVQVFYVDADAPHPRAGSQLALDAATGAIRNHERYADKTLGARLLGSIFALHSGEYFGLVGRMLVMIASALMPLFAITGWLLYLDRRRKKRELRSARVAAGAPSAAGGELLVAFASQSGTAERLAWQTAGALQAAGVAVAVQPLAALDGARLGNFERAVRGEHLRQR
jgi:sulfite reductase (NADPH) flavoprotein alpha-component